MKKKLLASVLLASAMIQPLAAAKNDMFLLQNTPTHIEVNNRILAKVNGKAISVYDVMKKMDMIFYKQYPEYTSSVEARFQFYQMGWKQVLQELIDKELIMADAEESKLPVSQGDVRQEMEKLFGPNVIGNLDSIGMTYEEASKILEGDIIIRRMIMARVNSKAFQRLTPQAIREAYQQYAKENARPPEWTYRVVSIRDKSNDEAASTAQTIHRLLTEERVPLDELTQKTPHTGSQVTVSAPFTHSAKEASEAYRNVLQQLKPGTYSAPVAQDSRKKNEALYRVFFLQESHEGGAPPLSKVEGTIKNKLLDAAVAEESVAYIKRLREHFDVRDDQMIPDTFQPFIMR